MRQLASILDDNPQALMQRLQGKRNPTFRTRRLILRSAALFLSMAQTRLVVSPRLSIHLLSDKRVCTQFVPRCSPIEQSNTKNASNKLGNGGGLEL
jgi:hypothetical protein